ncbi:winged helix-turn-helix transcriptional regulator [Streptomyces sp. NPDC005141]
MTEHEAHCYELVADCRLRATIGGISDKVLTDTLRRLLSDGLIDRQAHAEAPPRVEYSLTTLGQSLVEGPMRELGRWAVEHGDALLEAQESAARTRSDSQATAKEP